MIKPELQDRGTPELQLLTKHPYMWDFYGGRWKRRKDQNENALML